MDIQNTVQKIASETGFHESGFVNISTLQYRQDIRAICEKSCQNYGAFWTCPPAVGTLEECKARVEQYDHMLLFTEVFPLRNSFDFKGMMAGMLGFKETVDRFRKNLEGHLTDFRLLSNEGCARCKKCTYPDEPCRFPHLQHHSLEGYGFLVNELAKEAGVRYNNGPNTVTYFGALLFRRED